MARRSSPIKSQQLVSILFMLVLLGMILTMRTRCANDTAKLFQAVSAPGSTDAATPSGPAPPPAH